MYELSGTLAGTGLPALLRFLAGLRKTGALHLTWSGGTGHVLLEDGRVTGAILGAAVGLPALEELMARGTDAAFSFEAHAATALAPTIDMDLESLLLHLDRPARDLTPTSAVIGPHAAAGVVTGGHCPELGFEDDRTHSFNRPTRLHRCFASEQPVPLTLEHQRDLCLSGAFGACPRLRLRLTDDGAPGLGVSPLSVPAGEADERATTTGRANGSASYGAVHPGAAEQAADEKTRRGRRRPADGAERTSAGGPGARDDARSAAIDGPAADNGYGAGGWFGAGAANDWPDRDDETPLAGGRAGAAGLGSAERSGGAALALTAAGGPGALGVPTGDRRADSRNGASGRADAGAGRGAEAPWGDVSLAPAARGVHGHARRTRNLIVLGGVAALLVLAAVAMGPRLLNGRDDARASAPTGFPPGSGSSGPAAAGQAVTGGRDTAAMSSLGTTATGAPAHGSAGTQASRTGASGAQAGQSAGGYGSQATGAAGAPGASAQAPNASQAGATGAAAQAAAASQTGGSGRTGAQSGEQTRTTEVVLDEHFERPTLNWVDAPGGPAQITAGAYRLWTREPGQFVALGVPLARTFDDVTVSATVHKAGGPPGGGFGLILRDQAESAHDGVDQFGHFYVLEVGDRGEVGIWRRENERWIDLVPWQVATAVHTGTETNTIVARAAGTHLSLAVNGTRVAAFDDPTYRAGSVGVFVGGDGNSVILDRLTIATP